MDNQNKWLGLINKKNILILLGAVIVVEVLWAGWTLYQTNRQIVQTVPPVATKPQPTQIELRTDKTSVKVGEKFTVSINMLSDKSTDGADLIINYDPKLLLAEPLTLGTLYNEYPKNTIDARAGKITVSGISTATDGIKPNGLFGSMVFTAKGQGQSSISLEFTPGSTVDTNIIEQGTGKDILEKVKNVEVTISP
ncbi:hypothetical protein HYS96_02835 [Candidatus Daviesbacteria bacterium]|nr:hypothetical protein [Candidatus Daviesbacteria bacterium]